MRIRSICAFGLALALAGCGAGNEATTEMSTPRLAAQIRTASDVIMLPGPRSRYAVFLTPTAVNVTDTVAVGGNRTLATTARLRFSDTSLAFDISANAGQAYRLYQAAFNRVPDPAGLGYWIKALDGGASISDVATAFVNSAEYRQVYGVSANDADIIASYYTNALHRAGDAGGIAYWLAALAHGTTRAQLLVAFSESAENQGGVLPAIVDGMAYREVGVGYAPLANAGPSQDITAPKLVTLDGGASVGSAGTVLSYKWTLTAKPAGSNASIVLPNTAKPLFQADLPGVYQATLVVSEGATDSAPAKVNIVALWQPAAGLIPAHGNFVYLESQQGDYIGRGGDYLYTSANATVFVTGSGAYLNVRIIGDQEWTGVFAAPSTTTRMVPGYYFNLLPHDYPNPYAGDVDWSGEGRGCSTATGWFYVDKVSYVNEELAALDLRFEQHCEGGAPALRGRLHWNVNEITSAPGPVLPIPTTLWTPAPALLPASGNYVYLDSASGDYIGAGKSYAYAGAASPLTVYTNGALLTVSVAGWTGGFQAMNSLSALQPGYYGDLGLLPLFNAVKGGLNWRGYDRGCDPSSSGGWFAVDSVTYTDGVLKALDLRFEQRCDGASAPLRGKVHWKA